MFPRLATRSALLACAVLALLGAIVVAGWLVPRLALLHIGKADSPLLIDLVLLVSSLVAAALVALVLYSARRVQERFERAEQVSQALERSEERYDAAIRGSFQGLWVWDMQAARVDFAPHCKTLLGYAADEQVSELAAWTGRIHPDDRERVTAAIDGHLLQRTPFDQEFRLAIGAEPARWVRARGQAIWNALGFPVRMAGSLADVSHEKRLEEDLRQKVEALAAASRAQKASADEAAAMRRGTSEFLASMSRHFRSPLTSVLGSAEVLLAQNPACLTGDSLLRIKHNSEQLLILIDDLLEFSKSEADTLTLERLLSRAISLAQTPEPTPAQWNPTQSRPDDPAPAMAEAAKFARAPGSSPASSPAAKPGLPLAGRRILLAGDRPDNQWLVTHHLQKSGAIVEVAADGLAAIANAHAAWKGGRAFDAVLMDMQMPVLDGFEATRRLRTQGYVFPILALTASAQSAERRKCLAAGCDDYLPKPIRVPQLLAMLTACLARLDAAGRDTQVVAEAAG